jgi:hypothetical protein
MCYPTDQHSSETDILSLLSLDLVHRTQSMSYTMGLQSAATFVNNVYTTKLETII